MKKRILTGDRTTGKLHLGHYVGTLENRVKMQHDYELFIMHADAQALTDNFEAPEKVRDAVVEVAMDNMAAGLDPRKVTLFIQSEIPQLPELTMYFMNLVTFERLRRNPTVKEEVTQKDFKGNVPVGFINYPISQAADILGFRADVVPVGEDQAPMLELTREVARRFNQLYGPVFPEPEIKVGRVARLVGTDGGSKMSKSLGNVIYLSDTSDIVRRKVMGMYTDPNRVSADVPGRVEGNPVFIYLDTFGQDEHEKQIEEFKNRYREGKVGDVEVKKYLVEVLEAFLEPVRQRRRPYEENRDLIMDRVRQGTERAREEAAATLAKAKQAMKLIYF